MLKTLPSDPLGALKILISMAAVGILSSEMLNVMITLSSWLRLQFLVCDWGNCEIGGLAKYWHLIGSFVESKVL